MQPMIVSFKAIVNITSESSCPLQFGSGPAIAMMLVHEHYYYGSVFWSAVMKVTIVWNHEMTASLVLFFRS